MTVSRRTALSVLGLGTVATIAPEDFSQPIKGGGKQEHYFGVAGNPSDWANKSRSRIVDALRRLADDIEVGGTFVHGMKLESEVKPEDFLTHTLQVTFILAGDAPQA